MKKIIKWLAVGVGATLALFLVVVAIVWIWGGQVMARTYVPEDRGFSMDAGPVDIAEGERLMRVLGCMGGCHGKEMEGKVLFDAPMFARVAPPNISNATLKYSDVELEAIIRQGIMPDGRGVAVMPASYFSALRDQDLRNIIGFMRHAPESDNDPGASSYSIMARLLFAKGEFKTAPEREKYEITPPRNGAGAYLEADYITRIKCSECHGRDLRGGFVGEEATPSLVLVLAYSEAEFTKLMRTGIARGDREVGLMSEISPTHFAYLRDEEIIGLYQFLQEHKYD